MPESLVFQINYEIIQEFTCNGIGKYIAVEFFGKSIYMLYNCVIDRCIVFRLASASLFKYFPGEGGEVYTFYRFRLPEVIDVVLYWLGLKDRIRNR